MKQGKQVKWWGVSIELPKMVNDWPEYKEALNNLVKAMHQPQGRAYIWCRTIRETGIIAYRTRIEPAFWYYEVLILNPSDHHKGILVDLDYELYEIYIDSAARRKNYYPMKQEYYDVRSN